MAAALPLPEPVAAAPRRPSFFGKYRELAVAIALFFLLFVSVLGLNFVISLQIADDAVSVNFAGRQRATIQRATNALLTYRMDVEAGRDPAAALKDLEFTTSRFDETIRALRSGGTTTRGTTTERVAISPLESAAGVELLDKAEPMWVRYRDAVSPVRAGNASPEQLAAAIAVARETTIPLTQAMDRITSELEREAKDRATVLRTVQVGAMLAALAIFLYILLRFVRRLSVADAVAEEAGEETRRILRTVREGLLLVDREGRIGSQMSAQVTQVFGRAVKPGEELLAVMEPLLEPRVLAETRDYIELLFAPHVREALVRELNPLAQVQVTVRDRFGAATQRFLSFQFNRVTTGGATTALLVTAQDVTAQVELERALAQSRQQAGVELGALAEVLAHDRNALAQFLARCRATLLEVNAMLETARGMHQRDELAALIDRAARRVHAIKGEASALRLTLIVELAHGFEELLLQLRGDESLSGERLLSLPLPLDDMLQKVDLFERIVAGDHAGPAEDGSPESGRASMLRRLATSVAADLNKVVETQVDVPALVRLDAPRAELVQELLVQMVRNAIAHGIELPGARVQAGKLASGLLQVWCRMDDFGRVEAGVRDDGVGIDPAEVRRHLVSNGRLTRAEAGALTDAQVIELLLRPGVSTAAEANHHAGRGVGLDLVQEHVSRLGARLRLSTRPGRFCEFCVQFTS